MHTWGIKGSPKCTNARNLEEKLLTTGRFCVIVFKRDKIQVFFLCLNLKNNYFIKETRKHVEVEKCVQKSLQHVPSANSVTTILPRIRKLILTEWKPRNIVDFARHILCTKKQNKFPQKQNKFLWKPNKITCNQPFFGNWRFKWAIQQKSKNVPAFSRA